MRRSSVFSITVQQKKGGKDDSLAMQINEVQEKMDWKGKTIKQDRKYGWRTLGHWQDGLTDFNLMEIASDSFA